MAKVWEGISKATSHSEWACGGVNLTNEWLKVQLFMTLLSTSCLTLGRSYTLSARKVEYLIIYCHDRKKQKWNLLIAFLFRRALGLNLGITSLYSTSNQQ